MSSPTLFRLAAAFNLLVGASMISAPRHLYALAGQTPPPTLFEPQLIGWSIAMFGLFYLLVGADPPRHRGVVRLSVVGKLGVVGVVWAHWLAGSAAPLFAALVAADVLWALAFLWLLRRTPRA